MKTRYILFILLFIGSFSLNAQRFNGGILAGFNAAQIDGDSWSGFYKSGLLLGAFVNTEFTTDFGGQLEIKYSGKGSSTSPKSSNIQKVRLNYIDLPVLVSYKALDALKIEAGVSFNYLYSASHYDGSWSDEWALEPNKFETALIFGVNYTLFNAFDFNVRYSYSLFPVRSADYSTSTIEEGAWFNNFISFGMYFNLGNKES